MITFTAGNSLVARASASKPFSPGMAMSMSTTFGKCFLVNSRASYPSPASATTSIPVIFSKSERMPARTRAWSSASSTRAVFMALAPERPDGSAPERTHGFPCRAQARIYNPFLRPTALPVRAFQAVPGWRPAQPSSRQNRSRRPAPPGAGLRRPMQFDAHRLGPRMAHHVGQRLLSHPEAGRLDFRAHSFKGRVREKLDAKPGALRLLVEVPAQRRHQPQVIQKRRTKIQGELAHLLQEPFEDRNAIVQPPYDGGALLQALC